MIELKKRYSAGKFLKTMILEERGLTQKWLAQKIGCAERKISEICNSKRRITSSFALELEKVFGISAEFWVSMQSKWDVFVDRQRKKEVFLVPSLTLPPSKPRPRTAVMASSAAGRNNKQTMATRRMATRKKRS